MSKVIALQETQLSGVKGAYFGGKNVSVNVNNNASVINSAFEAPQPQIDSQIPTPPSVNMESAPVNLNPNPVINPGVTDQVFGQTPSVPEAPVEGVQQNDVVNAFQQPAGGQNMFDVPSGPSSANEPVQIQPEVVNAPQGNIFDSNPSGVASSVDKNVPTSMSTPGESVSGISIADLNALRNKIDTFSSEMHAEIDKIQESLNVVEQSAPVNEDVKSASDLIGTNLDETMVIPRDVMNTAIDQTNQGKGLAA